MGEVVRAEREATGRVSGCAARVSVPAERRGSSDAERWQQLLESRKAIKDATSPMICVCGGFKMLKIEGDVVPVFPLSAPFM